MVFSNRVCSRKRRVAFRKKKNARKLHVIFNCRIVGDLRFGINDNMNIFFNVERSPRAPSRFCTI